MEKISDEILLLNYRGFHITIYRKGSIMTNLTSDFIVEHLHSNLPRNAFKNFFSLRANSRGKQSSVLIWSYTGFQSPGTCCNVLHNMKSTSWFIVQYFSICVETLKYFEVLEIKHILAKVDKWHFYKNELFILCGNSNRLYCVVSLRFLKLCSFW